MIQAIKLGMKPMLYTSEYNSAKNWKNTFNDRVYYDAIKRKKPTVYSASLENPNFKDNDVILFYDTYDVLFFGDESHFKSSFQQISAHYNKSVFIGGELNNWPFQHPEYKCIQYFFFIYFFFFFFLKIFIYLILFLFFI